MVNEKYFQAAETILVRLPLLPVERASATCVDMRLDAGDAVRSLREFLLGITCHPAFREAVEVSSGSLAAVLSKVEAGEDVPRRRLERAALSATRYLLRAAMRPTPFGLMAGVALGSFSKEPAVRVGDAHAKTVLADSGWAEAFVAGLIDDPRVRDRLSVAAGNLCFTRGDRIVLPLVRVSNASDAEPAHEHRSEVTVRNTRLVRFALERARRPMAYRDLLDAAHGEFAELDKARIDAALTALVQRGFLVADMAPRSDDPDPLGPARRVLSGGLASAGLDAVDSVVAEYAAKPVGDGGSAWRGVRETMADLVPGEASPVQVDLRFDGDFALPYTVKEELEKAASALWKMTDPTAGYGHLKDYHDAFVEHYGLHQVVPVLEMLDPHSGLGAPAGYLNPPSHRHLDDQSAERYPHGARELAPEHEEYLSELVESALIGGRDEITLDDGDVERLAHADAKAPVGGTDLCVQILADSVEAMSDGRFTLVMSPFSQGSRAGSMIGRFVGTLRAHGPVGEFLSARRGGEPIYAQVHFRPVHVRGLNVCAVPQLLDHAISVGEFPGQRGELIALDDLAVGATADRLYLVRLSDGREVVPVVPHALDLTSGAPNAVRFLSEIPLFGESRFRSWGWGKRLRSLPYLPRVRYGRTILSLARWRPGVELSDKEQPWHAWRAAFEAWREKWRVPAKVQVASGDRRVELDLASDWHCRLLRHELLRSPDSLVYESPLVRRSALGWSAGYASEVVVPLLGTADGPAVSPVRGLDLRRSLPSPPRHAPGGEWLYAKLYMANELQDGFLGRNLPYLLNALPDCVDRWFYIRYLDPDPHLRLRFHGEPRRIWGELLPALDAWLAAPENSRLIRNWMLDTYVPESARYGGAEALPLAEGLFRADSEVCAGQLHLRANGKLGMPAEALAAMNFADILAALGDWDWRSWVVRTFPRPAERLSAEIRELLPSIGGRDLTALSARIPGIARMREYAEHRAGAAAAYGRHLFGRRAGEGEDVPAEFSSLLHMHANRLLGVDRNLEDRARAVLRAAAQSQLARRA
ncbi:hypothetical protein GTY75_20935 [Streptomyces sp. SID8381]|uniref:lantibiotic dehydratase n=1 Tax=unclassified Streptomyces TaxID=2593676 RepID=UPI00035D105C|nr:MULTISPECIES: lantibiotic dehydratase [unclassified Streptomyces]MYX29067.1 hypothetical protein [Streptomyces sp. SID8381]